MISKKSRTITLLLLVLFGGLGIHRFYVGKIGTGLLMLFTLILTAGTIITVAVLFWVLFDLGMIVTGNFRDKKGNLVLSWTNAKNNIPFKS